MYDATHMLGYDLAVGPGGDLALSDGSALGQQRVLRRLMTNPGDYLWELSYGAGLGAFVGQPVRQAAIEGVIRAQMLREASVSRTPEPLVDVRDDAAGNVYAHVRYVDAPSGQTQAVNFTVPA